jgi:hypothetical protein
MNTWQAKEPVKTPDRWPVAIGEQMAAAHRMLEMLSRCESPTPGGPWGSGLVAPTIGDHKEAHSSGR